MARTIQIIYDALVADKETRAELSGLTSTSRTALWRMWLWIVAAAMHVHEQLWDAFKSEVEDIAARAIPGSLRWYADRAKEFQLGFNLVFDLASYRYFYLDTTSDSALASRIIAQVSVQEVFGSTFNGVRVKVAKADGDDLEPLSNEELTAFEYYMHRLRFAGVAMDVISRDADDVKANLRIFYDGVLPLTQVEEAIETSLKAYLKAIPFDGLLNRNALVDALQSMTEVIDVEVLNLQAKPNGSSSWSEVVRNYSPVSGYYALAGIGNDFSTDTVIEYIPE
jgi:hypothetical protein